MHTLCADALPDTYGLAHELYEAECIKQRAQEYAGNMPTCSLKQDLLMCAF